LVPVFSHVSDIDLLSILRRRNAQKNEDSPIQPHHVFVCEAPNAYTGPRFGNGCNLIHHQPARSAQAVAFCWLDEKAKQRSVSRIGCECADGYRIRLIESVVLKNHCWTGLSSVILAARDGPNFAALHFNESDLEESGAPPQSDTASMKS
jgi:hypothetical protein